MFSNTTTVVILSSLGTLLALSVIRDIKHYVEKNKYNPVHQYEVGEVVICNTCSGKPIKCEIIELRRYTDDNECGYKVVSYYSDGEVRVETVREKAVQCTLAQFGIKNFKVDN